MTPASIATQLETNGYCVCPNFLNPSELFETKNDLDSIQGGGGFHRAGVGDGAALGVHDSVRRDQICWLERGFDNVAQSRLWAKMDLLKGAFNAPPFYLGLDSFEGHYACYPTGGYYKRHLDRVDKENGRVVSLIVYLNLSWKPEDGGRLRIFENGTAESLFSDVDPVGGTMVCFMSDTFEHEVQTSFANRYSFSGWFKR